ncbi:MAG: hypothetical protein CMB32_01665 [Euryarchaeota archaeon]|nr:hypothetical protein [Euryarchaeota archaeon]|tara:strand:+ start:322 stop:1668 length:1347 start_codon:yes stop_codon:yes gene_type:complete
MIKYLVWRNSFALLFFVVMSIVGCRKPDSSIGIGNLPDEDLLSLVVIDTLEVKMTTVRDDSLSSENQSSAVLGRVFQPRIGETYAGFASQLRLSAPNINFGTNPVADSIYLSLRYTGHGYGEYSNHTILVRELADTLHFDSTYYSSYDPETTHGDLTAPSNGPLSIKPIQDVITETDTTAAELKINLAVDFAQSLLDQDTSVFSSNENWLEHFPGIVVRSVSGHGASNFDISSGLSVMRIHYHNDVDTTFYDFVLSPLSARVNLFSNNYVSALDRLNLVEADSAYIPGDNLLYVMSGGGLKVKVEFPGIEQLNHEGALGNRRSIQKAELILTHDDCNYDSRYPAPDFLAMGIGLESGFIITPDHLSSIGPGGSYDSSTKEYRINITRTIQHILNRDSGTGDYGVFSPDEEVPPLYITTPSRDVSIQGVVLKGTDVNENNARLVLTCVH